MNDLKFSLRQLLKNPASPATLRGAAGQDAFGSSRAGPGQGTALGRAATDDEPWPCSRRESVTTEHWL